MRYKHLDQSGRDRIEAMLKAGHTRSQIADILKVNKSTVSREINNRKKRDGRYDAETAQHKAHVKRMYSKYQGMKIEGDPVLRSLIIEGLKQKRSPDEISGRINEEAGYCVVNHKATYKWLYSIYGEKYCHLLCTKRRKKKKQDRDKQPRVMIPNLVSIHAIPGQEIQYEGDTFVSPRRCQTTVSVAVAVHRTSKLILAKKISGLRPDNMVSAMRKFQKQAVMKNVVLDRGIENQRHEKFGIPAYFADAQSPYQKPLVEGSIGLGRRWFWPKGTDLSKISDGEIKRGIDILNNKYRRSLGYRSAIEVARGCGILKGDTDQINQKSCT